ncbi:MAG TPA: class I SAM-dependent methyltransferase [Thermodesulforhabdus norvegica]|uniref:Class I SAM-dependent methyltransferase n=1 Tax=Thermodesulforhabdus norvegica TaxID=39841 RepID=A0A7C0WV99_9BACT|nr:class I SAM-dependent methyltransferase [Thermodesulforhabdus norvegica]
MTAGKSLKGYIFGCPEDMWFEYSFLKPTGLASAVERSLNSSWKPHAACRVLEVCCGSGRFLVWLDKKGHHATGLEISEELVVKARKRLPPRVEIVRGEAKKLPFANSSFDYVFFIFGLEYVHEPAQAVREALRVARLGIIAIILNPYSPALWNLRIQSQVKKTHIPPIPSMPIGCIKRAAMDSAKQLVKIKTEPIWTGGRNWKHIPFKTLFAPLIMVRIDKAITARIRDLIFSLEKPFVVPGGYGNITIQRIQKGKWYERINFVQKAERRRGSMSHLCP